MTAIRVVTDHQELENSGAVTHTELDAYVNTTPFLVVSGTTGDAISPGARKLKAGPGITLVDTGPGGDLIIQSTAATTGSSVAWMERPTGVNDGVNLDFLLAHTPVPSGSVMFFINGVLQEQGPSSDYVIVSGSTIRINHRYRKDSNLVATYPY